MPRQTSSCMFGRALRLRFEFGKLTRYNKFLCPSFVMRREWRKAWLYDGRMVGAIRAR